MSFTAILCHASIYQSRTASRRLRYCRLVSSCHSKLPACYSALTTIFAALSSSLSGERTFLPLSHNWGPTTIRLPPGTSHHIELELLHHPSALPTFRFRRPRHAGSSSTVTYPGVYEDTPHILPYIQNKRDCPDTTKSLIGLQEASNCGIRPPPRTKRSFRPSRGVHNQFFT